MNGGVSYEAGMKSIIIDNGQQLLFVIQLSSEGQLLVNTLNYPTVVNYMRFQHLTQARILLQQKIEKTVKTYKRHGK